MNIQNRGSLNISENEFQRRKQAKFKRDRILPKANQVSSLTIDSVEDLSYV